MGLFSKETCCLCNKSVGILGRIKLVDKNYLCKDCEKEVSSFINITRFTKEEVLENIEYMKKQDILYQKEYEELPKEQKDRYACVDQGIVFADTIGMFEVLSGKSKCAKYHELFRYDQIASYEKYEVLNPNKESRYKFSESGIIIKMKSKKGFSSLGKTDNELNDSHPFVEEFKIRLGKESDSSLAYSGAINHLDRIFLKEETYKSFGQTIKEDFIGTETERRHRKEDIADFKNLAGIAKAKIKGDTDRVDDLKENLKESMLNKFNEAFGACDRKYTKFADEAEKRAWRE